MQTDATKNNFTILFSLYIAITFFMACGTPLYDAAKSPAETLASFTLDSNFVIDVFAAEPLVADPVEMIIDHRGRIFVVEMPDYPFKPEPGQGLGKIKQLFDDDQDGQIDRAVVFADHISEATSVHPWRDGLLVAAAPSITWMKDLDGDGKADTSEVIFTGFFENNSEAQITNLKFMPDNWIYASNHGQGGEVQYLRDKTGNKISMAGGDFRFRLDQNKYELVSGPAQFGHAFNDNLHRFVTQNTLHIRHPVIPWSYLQRNPYLPSKNATTNVSDHDLEMFQLTPPPYWRAERTRRRQKSYDEQGQGRIEYAEDHFTGASGATFYGGDAFPSEYYGSIFIGDVAGNLIHRDVLKAKENSPTYIASRPDGEHSKEFLASTDSWFRPANFTVGPDGFLYVIDMYRQHIETPLSIPEDLKKDMDFLEGSDRGRIYRIRPADKSITTSFEDISKKNSAELIQLLQHANRWHRLQAQRLLLEKNDKNNIAPLNALWKTSENELTRLHAFYVLEALGGLNQDLLKKALQDPSPIIREQAILLLENLPDSENLIGPLINDSNIRVAFQACLSLGNFTGDQIEANLFSAYTKNPNPFFHLAILSSPAGSSFSFLNRLINQANIMESSDSADLKFVRDIAFVIGNRQQDDEIIQIQKLLLDHLATDQDYQVILQGFLPGLKKSNKNIELLPAIVDQINQLKQTDPEKWSEWVD